jgi:peptidoglycan-associated lipoprotein
MKQLPVAGKALTIIFTILWMVGCASTDTTETETPVDTGPSAAEQAEMQKQAALQSAKDKVAVVGNIIYFEFDQSTLQPDSRRILDAHIALANQMTGISIRLEGHADERGTREYNMALGERRANAVASYMAGGGVSSSRMEAVSYGEERPVASGSGEANWAKNRRVEIK